MNRNANPQAGFSLVEISFALLVVAIGMTSVIAMFPEGLRCTRKAVDNTETALFADYVFSTLELTAGFDAAVGHNVKAESLPAEADEFISLSFSETARKSGDKHLQINTGSNKGNSFYWMPDFYGVPGSDTMNTSYFEGKFKTAVFTYDLSLQEKKGSGSTIVAVLKVWPGEFDATAKKGFRDEDARIFYREILPPK